jgi:AraC family transcriptional regulator of adaptative response/methylated-DNA-[protein]-cysteine methyltransferase
LLREGRSVLDSALDAGLSGPGRLHDLCVNLEAASPGEFKTGGEGWTITAGFVECPFGTCLVGKGPRGICYLSFVESASRRPALAAISSDWPHAQVEWDDDATARGIAPLFDTPPENVSQPPLRAIVRGSAFQLRVWRALLQIPRGSLISYGGLARAVGKPGAARAVGRAVGQNPLAYLIPCHRVIRETGAVSDYRWGRTRKQAIITWESSTQAAQPT